MTIMISQILKREVEDFLYIEVVNLGGRGGGEGGGLGKRGAEVGMSDSDGDAAIKTGAEEVNVEGKVEVNLVKAW